MNFTPIGDVSRRNMVIDTVGDITPGDIITYDALEMALGLGRPAVQAVVNAAKPGIQKRHQRSLVAVRGIGYRVLLPAEHLGLAQEHQKRGRRQTRRSRMAVTHTDYNELSELERVRFDIAIATLKALEAFERRADLRYASRERVESFITEQSKKNIKNEEEARSVQDRLARLEKLMRAS